MVSFLSIDNVIKLNPTLKYISNQRRDFYDLYFINGGDQNNDKIPEKTICQKLGIKLTGWARRKDKIFFLGIKKNLFLNF